MADLNLTQSEADALIAMEKHRVNEDRSLDAIVLSRTIESDAAAQAARS